MFIFIDTIILHDILRDKLLVITLSSAFVMIEQGSEPKRRRVTPLLGVEKISVTLP